MRQTNDKDFYTFFFTHLSQSVFKDRVGPWVDLRMPSQNTLFAEEITVNNVYFETSSNQPEGIIQYLVDKGKYVLDVSCEIDINDTSLSIDTTEQAVSNYVSTLTTPLDISSLNRSYNYDYIQDDQGNALNIYTEYPTIQTVQSTSGQFPFQKVVDVKLVDNPWYIEPAKFNVQNIPDSALAFTELTVDTTYITLDQTSIDNLDNTLLTIDVTNYLLESDPDSLLRLDPSPDTDGSKLVTLEKNPVGLGVLEWKVGSKITSKSWIPSIHRGYLPSPELSLDMKTTDLKTVALGILGLIAQQNEGLISSTIEELCSLWESYKAEGEFGLPTVLPRFNRNLELSKRRSTTDQAWLGIALVKAIRFFRDRQVSTIRVLPNRLEPMLLDLISSVSSLIDVSTSVTYTGFEDYVIDEADLEASFVSQLFLHSVLSVSYNHDAHQKASTLLNSLSDLDILNEDDVATVRTNQKLSELLITKMYWEVSHNLNFDASGYYSQLTELDELDSLNPFYTGLLDYISVFYADEKIHNFLDKSEKVDFGLYRYKTNSGSTLPSLSASTWIRIKIIGYNVLPLLDFELHSKDSDLFLSSSFMEAKRMLPFGYRWSGTDAESKNKGVLGSLLYSSTYPSFHWYQSASLLKNGINLTKSQAWALDNWGYTLNRVKPTLQSDTFFRETLFFNQNKSQCTYLGMEQLISSLYRDEIIIEEPNILSINLDEVDYEWNSSPEVVSSILPTTLTVSESPLYPTVNRIQNPQISTEWSEVVPYLNIYTYSYLPNLEEEILNNISAGVQANIYVCRYDEQVVKTYATV